MATIEGAQTVELGDEVGSLEAGKQADLILVEMTELNLSPVLGAPERNIVPNLVYAGSGHEVKTVILAGKVLMRDGEVLIADKAAICAQAQRRKWRGGWLPTRCTKRCRCWRRWRRGTCKKCPASSVQSERAV